MSLSDRAADKAEELSRDKLEAQLAEARHQRDEKAAALKTATADLTAARADADRLAAMRGIDVRAPKWAVRKARTKLPRATAVHMLSDWHFDEVVDPAQLVGPTGEPLNAYDRTIAADRLRRDAESTATVARDLLRWEWDGLVLLLGGDMLSGNIHDELARTNDGGGPIDSVDHWVDPMAAAMSLLGDAFGKVHVVGVVGNHGRNTRKPIAKGRVRDNFDWLLYRVLARHFAKDDRFTWNLPDSADAYFEVYGHRHVLTHGDQGKGGDGLTGLLIPMSKLDLKKRRRDQQAWGTAYSHMWAGHWHTYLTMGGVTVNGSGKGPDEYSTIGNFGAEEPKQAFAVVTPEHNVTAQLPIYCGDREAEGW